MKHSNKGFSLVEVLIAMAVMALGLLAVASFQTELLSESGTNKARGEALALAQARLDEFRNYTTSINNETAFTTTYATTAATVTESITGVNAVFTRGYDISSSTTSSSTRDIVVSVNWDDRRGVAQSVALDTKVAWQSPRAAGDIANDDREPLIKPATGNAKLGAGVLGGSATQMASSDGNGTNTMREGDDIKLSLGANAGDTVVLTLENACSTIDDSSCTDFVKIKGRVFFDTTVTQPRPPGEVYIKASDSAYCHRYYSTSTAIDSSTTLANLPGSTNNQYRYYDYTCYMGGGWHGNIGVIFGSGVAGGGGVNGNAQATGDFDSQSDVVCIGDPTSSLDDFKPRVALRRVYRGMLYVPETVTVSNPEGKQKVTVNIGGVSEVFIRYLTIGIGDAVTLPVAGQPLHDFMVSKKNGGTTDANDCGNPSNANKPLTHADSNAHGTMGDYFANMPTDFYCLNSMSMVDNFDSTTYSLETACPFNPAKPPALRHAHSGHINITDAAGLDFSSFHVRTTNMGENCNIVPPFSYSGSTASAFYSCNVYDWDATDADGWGGNIILSHNNPAIGCTTAQYSYTTIGIETGITADITTGVDFACESLSNGTITGTVIVTGIAGIDLTSMALSTSTGDICTFDNTPTFSHDGYQHSATYSCNVFIPLGDSSWSGNVILGHSNGQVNCSLSTLSVTVASNATNANNDFTCSGPAVPMTDINISGTLTVTANVDMQTAVAGIDVTATGGLNCPITPNTLPPHDGSKFTLTYNCPVSYITTDTGWTGTVSIVPNDSRLTCTPLSRNYITQPGDIGSQDFDCFGPIRIYGNVGVLPGNGAKVLAGVAFVPASAGTCTLAPDGKSYSCVTATFDGTSWGGTIRYTAENGSKICHNGVKDGDEIIDVNYTNLSADTADNTVGVTSNNGTCP